MARRTTLSLATARAIQGHRRVSKIYYVYLLASQPNGTLYIGVTNNLARRVGEHKEGLADGFTKKYGVKMLVYFEDFSDIGDALQRETRLKKFTRRRKLELIESGNPRWRDLADGL
jgi:putative endonuclease